MPGIGVISNPNARLNKLYPKIKDRLTFIVGRGGEVASTGTLDDAQSAAEAFRACEIDLVAICGGDGTAHRTLELLLQVYGEEPLPPILLLPSGTQNMVPSSFGIQGSSVYTMLMAQARYRHNVPMRCIRRNLLEVNGHFAFMFGLGAAPRILKLYYETGETHRRGAAKLFARVVVDGIRGGELASALTRPMALRYRLDEGPQRTGSFHSAYASFVEKIPLGVKPFPRACWDKNVFEVLLMSGTVLDAVPAIPLLFIGSIRPTKAVHREMARSLEIEIDAAEHYTLDGEIYGPTTRFRISAGPELRFVVPGLGLRRTDPRVRSEEVGPWGLRYFI